MAYFLKKSNLKKGTYLQIYESFYDSAKKQTAHRSHKAIGYVNELMGNGIEDPVAFYSEEVKKLNQELFMHEVSILILNPEPLKK